MPEERPLSEVLLDYAVFAPIGLFAEVVADLPELSEKGRSLVEKQVNLARMVGRLACGRVRHKFDRGGEGSHPTGEEETVPESASAVAVRGGPEEEEVADRAEEEVEQPSAGTLAIPGYDTLAASQVVQRLASLEPDELDAVRRYEMATRGRRTILHRISQLSTGAGRASA